MTDLSRVSKDDIEQEAALLRLMGKTPNKALIYKRLSRQEAIFDEVPVGASLLWDDDPHTDPAVTEALVDWALQQTDAVAGLIFEFLEEPTDEAMAEVLKNLKAQGVEIFQPDTHKEKSLTQVILDLLKTRPHTIQELYDVSRSIQPSNRPEAAVRQILRRLTKHSQISIKGDLVKLI